jgi:biopolymer transport protein ExbD
MIKARLTVYVLIFMFLIFMLSLAGCASEAPVTEPEVPAEEAEAPEEEEAEAEPEPIVLSFEAQEYVNSEYGFSVQYPADWVENEVSEGSTIVYYVVSEERVPLMFINVDEAATFEDALNGAIDAAEGSKVKIDSQEDVRLAGGIDATRAIFKFNHPAVPVVALDAMALGAQKDGKWIVVTVATLGAIFKFDEALFTEIVSNLSFE